MLRRRGVAILSVIVLVSLFLAVPARGEHFSVDRIFWSDCGPNRTICGEIYTDCDGNTSSWGVTTNYEERWVDECDTGRTWHFWIGC